MEFAGAVESKASPTQPASPVPQLLS